MNSSKPFEAGDPVLVWLKDLSTKKATVWSRTSGYPGKSAGYWVHFDDGQVQWYDEELVFPVSGADGIKCDCGSQKLKHPGHSFWCSVEKYKTRGKT